jgi:5'-nucleotidase
MTNEQRRYKVLISNDDGVSAPGLRAIVHELVALDICDVHVCGPFGERSAQSNAITVGGKGPLHAFQIPSIDGVIESFAVDGTPADSVMIALRSDLLTTKDFDLVVSGINRGDNSGIHVVYSGTVGAAREATQHGIPAMAFSLDDHNARTEEQYKASAKVACALIEEVLLGVSEDRSTFEQVVINVNVPSGEEIDEFKGVHLCRQGRHTSTSDLIEVDFEEDYHEKNAHKDTQISLGDVAVRGFRHRNFRHVVDDTPLTDFALLSDGWVVVTLLDSLMDIPLHPDDSAARFNGRLIDYVRLIIHRAGKSLGCVALDDRGVSIE